MIIFREANEFDYIHTDSVLLADALLDRQLREADILDRTDIINQIHKNDFDNKAETFKQSLDIAIKRQYEEHLTQRSLSSLKRMKTFKVKDINAGFALSQMKGASGLSEIVALHNASEFRRLGSYLIQVAISLGGKYLECSSADLKDKLYITMGFEVYKTIENAKLSNGKTETIYFMKLKNLQTPRV